MLNHVYALIKSGKVVYVGCTSRINERISDHKRTKDFDGHVIIKSYIKRRDALIAENAIIRFLGVSNDDTILNSLHANDVHKSLYL